jgi:arsenate reductase
MASQPIRPGAAPAGRAVPAAAPNVTGHQQSVRPESPQPARLRLLPGLGHRGTEGCPLVVFLGVGDDRRSRIAAALLAHRAEGRVQVISMSRTTAEPDPTMVEALAAIGVDLLGWRSWPRSQELLRRAAAVVVMGYDSQTLEELPRAEDWFIDDPAGKDRETLRYLRDAIDRQVQRLLFRLGGAVPAVPTQREKG